MKPTKRRIEMLERRRPPGHWPRVIIYEASEVPEEPETRKLFFTRLRPPGVPDGAPVIFLPDNHRGSVRPERPEDEGWGGNRHTQ